MPSRTSNVLRILPSSWDACRVLVDSVVDYAIFMLDLDGRVLTWNLGAERIKGYAATEIVGEHFSRFYTDEDVRDGKPERELETARRFGRATDEGWRVRRDGSRFWASVVITALLDEDGRLRGFGKVTRDLTARRAHEEELRRAEMRYHHLVDAVLDYAIFMLDPNGCVSTWNAGARRVKGYSVDEIVGQHFSVFYTPEDRAAGVPEHVLDTVRREGRYEAEGWRVRKDGSRFWANLVITSLRDEDGKLAGFVKVTRDLTDRRAALEELRRSREQVIREQTAREVAEAAEGSLRRSEERYRALGRRLEIVFEGVADAILAQDRSGRVVLANCAAARFFGLHSGESLVGISPGDIQGRYELLDDRGEPIASELLPGQRVLAGEPAASAVIRVRDRTTGREGWSSVRASAVLDPDGRPELAISIWHDVTAERHEERRASLLASATEAIGGSLEGDGMLAALSRALVPGLGVACAIYLIDGETLTATPELDDRAIAEKLARAAHTPSQLEALRTESLLAAPISVRGRVLGVLALRTTATHRAFVSSDAALVAEIAQRVGVAMENAQLYRAAQSSARAAEEASRAKDEFLATLSHELRTPLTAVLGWSARLKDRVTDPTLVKPIAVIHRNATAQLRIIEDILDVSRVITGKFRLDVRSMDLAAVAREAIEVVRPSAEAKKLDLALELECDPCPILGDPERLRQVTWNLLSNAVKFTNAGGSIRLTLRREHSDVTLTVTDTGLGIEPGFLPFVFDRFKQADSSLTRRVGGLGLGLALVRHIVELHGGKVAAASGGPRLGTSLTVTLPVRRHATLMA